MRILVALVTGLSLLWPALAAAQDFPNRTIRLIVPFPAGGPNDIIARVVGQRMSEIIKQPDGPVRKILRGSQGWPKQRQSGDQCNRNSHESLCGSLVMAGRIDR